MMTHTPGMTLSAPGLTLGKVRDDFTSLYTSRANTLHASVGLHERLGSDVQNDVKLTQPSEATLGCQRVRVQRPRVNSGDMSGEGTLAEAWGLGAPPLP